jgi:peroxiredoxin
MHRSILLTTFLICTAGFCHGQDEGGTAGNENSDPEKPEAYIEGLVYDHIGGGVEDVTVTAETLPEDGGDGEPLGEATTNHLGDFKIELSKAYVGPARVKFVREGFNEIEKDIEITNEYPPFVDVEMVGANKFFGHVVDALTQNAIAGAKITVEAAYRKWDAESDENGRFTVEGLPPGHASATLEADDYGREQQRLESTKSTEEEPIVFELHPERIVKFQIRDVAEQPISGAAVEMLSREHNDYRTAVSDANGEITFKGVRHDTAALALRIVHERYISSTGFDRTIELPSEERESTHAITLDAAGSLEGKVIDVESRQPLGGARILVGTSIGGAPLHTFSDYDGTYVLHGLRPGEQLLTVQRTGNGPARATVVIKPGETAQYGFKLPESKEIEGIVVNEKEAPVQGALVVAQVWQGAGGLVLEAYTDRQGKFTLTDAPPDELTIAVSHPSHAPLVDIKVQAGSEPARIILEDAPERPQGGQTLAAMPKVGEDAPDFSAATIDGKTIALADFKGKVVMIDFWATWCGPCVAELPNVKAVQTSLGERDDFCLISVSLDHNEKALKKFIDKQEMTWTQIGGEGADDMATSYGVQYIPAVFVIDKDGKIAATGLAGPGTKSQIESILEE